jgi:dissimilatory sulfite reductase related protein
MPTKTYAGKTVEVDDEGFLKNPADWIEAMAPELAREDGIPELTEQHWKVIRFMQDDFKANGQIPTIRRIKNTGGIPTNILYELFPGGPAKKAARAAGLGKPQGCV